MYYDLESFSVTKYHLMKERICECTKNGNVVTVTMANEIIF